MATIIVIIGAFLLVPQGNANIVPLGVHYTAGEKLTYDVTTSTSSQTGNTSTSYSSQGTLTVEVVSFDGSTYTLNYTTTNSLAGYSMTTSRLLQVKETDMVNVLTLLPVALQQYTSTVNDTNPIVTAVFNQSQAKVGDTWQIPLNTPQTGASAGEITITFKAIQDLTVPAGNFKVFRIDFSTTTNLAKAP